MRAQGHRLQQQCCQAFQHALLRITTALSWLQEVIGLLLVHQLRSLLCRFLVALELQQSAARIQGRFLPLASVAVVVVLERLEVLAAVAALDTLTAKLSPYLRDRQFHIQLAQVAAVAAGRMEPLARHRRSPLVARH